MKKLLLLPVLLLVFKVQAQESAVFKIKYMPNHSYDGEMTINVACKVNLSGNDSVIAKITAQGLTLPLAVNMDMKMGTNIKTAQPASDGNFHLLMNFSFNDLNMELNGNKIPMPTDKLAKSMTLYGHCGADGVFQTDSIAGQKSNDSINRKMNQMTNNFQKNIKFPDHPMKVGESFTQGLPLNLPMMGNNLNFDAKTTYMLTKIENGYAYFDVTPSLNMSLPIKGNILTLTGTGSGKMVYSIKDNFSTDYTMTLNLKVGGEIETVKLDATADLQMGFKNTVTAN